MIVFRQALVRLTILKNIAIVTHALLTLFKGARGGNGWLSKAALARCMPLETGPKEREQRLYRLLNNPRFTPEILIPLHVAIVCGIHTVGRLPMILDQTTIRGIEALLVGLVFEGRVLPVAFSCFTHQMIRKSQNALEQSLIMAVMSYFPADKRPLLIMDRGYARVSLLIWLRHMGIPYLVRARGNVIVYFQGKARLSSAFSCQTRPVPPLSCFLSFTEEGATRSDRISWQGVSGTLVSTGSTRYSDEFGRDHRDVLPSYVH